MNDLKAIPAPQPELPSQRSVSRMNRLAYLCVGAALLLVVAITGWAVQHDLANIGHTLVMADISRMRSHAMRNVVAITEHLHQTESIDSLRGAEGDWLRDIWERVQRLNEGRLYYAVVDAQGKIVLHTSPELQGLQLPEQWFERQMPDLGTDVVETSQAELTGGVTAFDVGVPIIYNNREVGVYHSGFNRGWFNDLVAERRSDTLWRWCWVLAFVAAVVVAASLSLYRIVSRSALMEQEIRFARVRQLAELGQLITAIAHEVRNPLNAVRLNLHVLRRLEVPIESSATKHLLLTQNASEIIDESNREIQRVEDLMQIVLGYAVPERPRNEIVEIDQELTAALNFFNPVMGRDQIRFLWTLDAQAAMVEIDRSRLRQIILNLLSNAKEAVGEGGQVWVRTQLQGSQVEIIVEDDGPGVLQARRDQIFEPFYSTKELGTGLGLALVKRFVEEARGTVVCRQRAERGACFCVTLPKIPQAAEPESGPSESKSAQSRTSQAGAANSINAPQTLVSG